MASKHKECFCSNTSLFVPSPPQVWGCGQQGLTFRTPAAYSCVALRMSSPLTARIWSPCIRRPSASATPPFTCHRVQTGVTMTSHHWPTFIPPARCSSQLASLYTTSQVFITTGQSSTNRCSSVNLSTTSQVFITTGQSLYNQPGVHQTWCLPPKNTQEYQNIKQKNPKATTPQTLDTKQQKLRQNVQKHDYPIHKCGVKCVALQMSTYDIWYVNSHIILLADNGETKPLARPLHELHRKDIIQVLLSGLLVITVHQYSYTGWCLSQDLNGTIVCCFSKILLVHLWTKQGQNYWLYSVSFFKFQSKHVFMTKPANSLIAFILQLQQWWM